MSLSISDDPTLERATAWEHKRFMQPVGSIQYFAVVTRPDLAFAAHILARHMGEPRSSGWLPSML